MPALSASVGTAHSVHTLSSEFPPLLTFGRISFFLGRNEREILLSMEYLKEQLFKQQQKNPSTAFLKSGASVYRVPKGKGSGPFKSTAPCPCRVWGDAGFVGHWHWLCRAKKGTTAYGLTEPSFDKGFWHQIFDPAVKNQFRVTAPGAQRNIQGRRKQQL